MFRIGDIVTRREEPDLRLRVTKLHADTRELHAVRVTAHDGPETRLGPAAEFALVAPPLEALQREAAELEARIALAATAAGRGPQGLALNLAKSEATKARGLLMLATAGGAAEGSG